MNPTQNDSIWPGIRRHAVESLKSVFTLVAGFTGIFGLGAWALWKSAPPVWAWVAISAAIIVVWLAVSWYRAEVDYRDKPQIAAPTIYKGGEGGVGGLLGGGGGGGGGGPFGGAGGAGGSVFYGSQP